MDKRIKESLFCIFIYYFSKKIRFNFKKDNLSTILESEINIINKEYFDYFSVTLGKNNIINIEIKDLEKINFLDNEIFYSIALLSIDNFDFTILDYINSNFIDGEYKKELLYFFNYILDNISRDEALLNYINLFENKTIKNLMLFYYYGIGNDNFENIKKSIYYIDELIEQFPLFVSFYLFRVRQNFNLFYRVIIGKSKFNKLVTNINGSIILLNHKIIQNCLNDFDFCESISPEYSTIYLYKGKLLLHLLKEEGIDLLIKSLKLEGKLYDFEVFAWIGVYYLQKGDYKKSEFFINKSLENPGDMSKYYGKLLFMYILSGEINKFINFLLNLFKDIDIIIYMNNKYFIMDDKGYFIPNDNFIDKYDLKYRMGFKLNDAFNLVNNNYETTSIFLSKAFPNISRNYFDHWNSDLDDKIIFYSKSNFGDN